MTSTILVTGGAGYIGSHTTVELLERGFEVVIVDNLINSSFKAIETIEALTAKSITFHQVDLTDNQQLAEVFAQHPISAVIHFAGLKAVGESAELPLTYYQTNLIATMNLLEQMAANEVWDMVFSSSATVYGDPETLPIAETAPTAPANPYGRTKLWIEHICKDLAASDPRWRFCMLRYFNPIGAHPSGNMGEDPNGIPNNLVPYIMQVAVGRRKALQIYGDDYDTVDGTGVRDYIHVIDLALGHIAALQHLENGWDAINLGTGKGASVMEVLKATEAASGKPIPYKIANRRSGDIATSLADPSKANQKLQWRANRTLQSALEDSWRWQAKNPNGFND